jgi:hypothetical protein
LLVSDILTINGTALGGPDFIVASPPCQEFSKYDAPGLFPDYAVPSTELVEACFALARRLAVPICLENVRGLQKVIGQAVQHYGPFYLWGDGVPPLMPHTPGRSGRHAFKGMPRRKRDGLEIARQPKHRNPARRAVIPFELAYHVALCAGRIVEIRRAERPAVL